VKKPCGIDRRKKQARLILLACCVLVGVLATAVHPVPAESPFGKVPLQPTAEGLKQARPDLAVENLQIHAPRFAAAGTTVPARVTLKIHNVGVGRSRPARLTCTLIGPGRRQDHWSVAVKPLTRGAVFPVTWKVRLAIGVSEVRVSLDDPVNPANNTGRKKVTVRSGEHGIPNQGPGKQVGPAVSGPLARMATRPGAGIGMLRPDLAVTRILFDRETKAKNDEVRVQVEVRNVGSAISRPSRLLATVRRADGSSARNSLTVPALRPGRSVRLHYLVRMTEGNNRVTAQVRDSVGPANNSLTRRFSYRAQEQVPGVLRKELVAKPAGPAGKRNSNVPGPRAETLRKPGGQQLRLAAQVAGTTRNAEDEIFFQLPEAGAVVKPGDRMTIKVAFSSPPPESGSLRLVLHPLETAGRIPDLVVRDDLTRSGDGEIGIPTIDLVWPVPRNQPTGQYQLRLETIGQEGAVLLCRVPIRIDRVRFAVTGKTVAPAQPVVSHRFKITYRLALAGSDANSPFLSRITVRGPNDFRTSCPVRIPSLTRQEPEIPLVCVVVPPVFGVYRAVLEVDAENRYPGSGDGIEDVEKTKVINVSPLPDLLVTLNKVTDGTQDLDRKHFHILVKNVGEIRSAPTTVLFRLTDMENKRYQVPALEPGASWEHEYTRRHWNSTGKKEYSAVVDPDNLIAEADEGNNQVYDYLRIYRAGEPRPRQKGLPPRVALVQVMGLEEPVTLFEEHTLSLRLKNTSPDRQVIGPDPDGGPDKYEIELWSSLGPIGNPGRLLADMDTPLLPGESRDFTFRYTIGRKSLRQFLTEDEGRDLLNQLAGPGYRISVGMEVRRISPRPEGKRVWGPGNRMRYVLLDVDIPVTVILPEKMRVRQTGAILDNGRSVVLGGGERIDILAPGLDSLWIRGRKVQVAWTGQVEGPYRLTLLARRPAGPTRVIREGVTVRSLEYRVPEDLPPGLYRVRVEGRGGRGTSPDVRVRAGGRPDLAIRNADIDMGSTGSTEKPYWIRVRGTVENLGGPLEHPFTIRVLVSRMPENSSPPAAILLDRADTRFVPLSGLGGYPFSATLNVRAAKEYVVEIIADSDDEVRERNEANNLFRNDHYTGLHLPDLRLTCRQEGGSISCWVVNQGRGRSGATRLELNCRHHRSILEKGRLGTVVSLADADLGPMEPGGRVEVERGLPFSPSSRDTCSAAVNRARTFAEENTANNTMTWRLSVSDSPTDEDRPLESVFAVQDRTSRIDRPDPGRQSGDDASPFTQLPGAGIGETMARMRAMPAYPRFRFTITNHSGQVSPPAVAILTIQGPSGQETVRTIDLPPLFPRSGAGGHVDALDIDQSVGVERGTRLRYVLAIRKRVGGAARIFARGEVQVER